MNTLLRYPINYYSRLTHFFISHQPILQGPARVTAKNILRKGYAPYPLNPSSSQRAVTGTNTATTGVNKKVALVDLVLGELQDKGW